MDKDLIHKAIEMYNKSRETEKSLNNKSLNDVLKEIGDVLDNEPFIYEWVDMKIK